MRLNRFQTLLDARGPDLDGWSAEDRTGAQALLARSEPAREALAEATALGRALAEFPVEPASPLLRSAILDIPEDHGHSARPVGTGNAVGGWSSRHRGASLGWTAIAASAVIGFSAGLWWPSEPPIWHSEDLVALVYGMPDFDPDLPPLLDEVLR